MLNAFEQLLLPAECLLCRSLLPFPLADSLVCPLCRHRWRRVVPPWCARCGQPEPHFGPCRLCADWPRPLRSARSAVWLEGGARDAIHALKYHGLPKIARDMADAMARVLPRPDASSVLVPVPLGRRRERERGYNQSERLADALSRRWELPAAGMLTRVRDTMTQTALTPKARVANVAGAFAMKNVQGPMINDQRALDIEHSTLIIVDDVFTTGATLAECARALEAVGYVEISAVTFGRAAIPDFS